MNTFCSKLLASGASLIGVRPGVGSADLEALRDAVLEVHDHRVVARDGAHVLKSNVVESRIQARGGALSGGVDGPAVGQEARGVHQVQVAEVSELARAGVNIPYRKRIVLGQAW